MKRKMIVRAHDLRVGDWIEGTVGPIASVESGAGSVSIVCEMYLVFRPSDRCNVERDDGAAVIHVDGETVLVVDGVERPETLRAFAAEVLAAWPRTVTGKPATDVFEDETVDGDPAPSLDDRDGGPWSRALAILTVAAQRAP